MPKLGDPSKQPKIKIPQRTEKSIETSFVAGVRRKFKGVWKTAKMNLWGQRDWPDRGCYNNYGLHLLIEFKRDGNKLSSGQSVLHSELIMGGHLVFVCYSAAEAYVILEKYKDVGVSHTTPYTRLIGETFTIDAPKVTHHAVHTPRGAKKSDPILLTAKIRPGGRVDGSGVGKDVAHLRRLQDPEAKKAIQGDARRSPATSHPQRVAKRAKQVG